MPSKEISGWLMFDGARLETDDKQNRSIESAVSANRDAFPSSLLAFEAWQNESTIFRSITRNRPIRYFCNK